MVIDTHAMLWWLEGDSRLSATAVQIFEEAEARRERLYFSPVSFWELRVKELRGQVRPRVPITEWPELLSGLAWLRIVAPDTGIWLQSAELNWTHRDPADRLIAATALTHHVAVLTKDQRFHSSDSPVRSVW